MSKGMWTKHFSADGQKLFYYNATLKKSAWTPPTDAVVHEAENMRPPAPESLAEIERRKNLEAAMAFTSDALSLQQEIVPTTVLNENQSSHFLSNFNPSSFADIEPSIHAISSYAVDRDSQNHIAEMQFESMDDVQARIAQAAASKQKQIKSKRFRSQDIKEEDSSSKYQKLVNVYQAMSGSKADDSSKWLVR